MDQKLKNELTTLTKLYFDMALSHVGQKGAVSDKLKNALAGLTVNEQAELPGYENRKFKFGKFENREFVVMMTDIRDSTAIINGPNGLIYMFLIFYVYAGIVAKIVDIHNGTSTEFLGDGVLNLFDMQEAEALQRSMLASWDIMEAREQILNPFFTQYGMNAIDLGIGIDHGITIVTQFGYRNDTDLKAFGICAYNASKLCKGKNEIIVSQHSQSEWPTGEGGNLIFYNRTVNDIAAYSAHKKLQ